MYMRCTNPPPCLLVTSSHDRFDLGNLNLSHLTLPRLRSSRCLGSSFSITYSRDQVAHSQTLFCSTTFRYRDTGRTKTCFPVYICNRTDPSLNNQNLLLACKTVSNEATPIWFSEGIFQFGGCNLLSNHGIPFKVSAALAIVCHLDISRIPGGSLKVFAESVAPRLQKMRSLQQHATYMQSASLSKCFVLTSTRKIPNADT